MNKKENVSIQEKNQSRRAENDFSQTPQPQTATPPKEDQFALNHRLFFGK
jgi:hypothetical protein